MFFLMLPLPHTQIVLKILVLGASNVGKTSIIERYVTNQFKGQRVVTVGADFLTKKLDIEGLNVLIQIWDTAGQERFQSGTLGQPFYRNSDGAILVYDVCNENSFEQLVQWRDEALSKFSPTLYFPIVVVGNKIDLRDQLDESKRISQTSVIAWCRENAYGHIETSAKDDRGVQAAMLAISALALGERERAHTHTHTLYVVPDFI